ncbi:MAG: hypothetical protein MJK18_08345, partial [Bdellovibrionales bacterium]|nr:hypothetical protein [Bdellovibrionales bacterium]
QLGLNIDESGLSTTQLNLLNEIKSNRESKETMVSALISQHRKYYTESDQISDENKEEAPAVSTLRSTITNLVKDIDLNQKDFNNLKIEVENKIEEAYGEVAYNKEHASIYSTFQNQRMQCFSGTSLYEIVRQLKDKPADDDAVIIFESGHVLPGYMKKAEGSSDYELVGIETTVKGRGKKSYGLAKDVRNVRVIEANFFVAIEVFETAIKNHQKVFDNALSITATKYGLDIDAMEDGISADYPSVLTYKDSEEADTTLTSLQERMSDRINKSIFAFGTSNSVPSGDRPRRTADEVEPTQSGSSIPGGQVFIGSMNNFPLEMMEQQGLGNFEGPGICQSEEGHAPISFLNQKTVSVTTQLSPEVLAQLAETSWSMPFLDIQFVSGVNIFRLNNDNESFGFFGSENSSNLFSIINNVQITNNADEINAVLPRGATVHEHGLFDLNREHSVKCSMMIDRPGKRLQEAPTEFGPFEIGNSSVPAVGAGNGPIYIRCDGFDREITACDIQ